MARKQARTFSPQMREQARELFDEGFGCNAIAGKLDISPSAISRWADEEGLRFDRSQAALAVRAHTIDLAQARLELAAKMMVVANDSLAMLDGPFTVFAFGGKGNDFNSQVLDVAPMEARRSAQMIAGVAFDKATRVVEKSSPGLDEAVGMLDTLASGFAAAAATLRAETPTDGE
jgi:transposase-like protein